MTESKMNSEDTASGLFQFVLVMWKQPVVSYYKTQRSPQSIKFLDRNNGLTFYIILLQYYITKEQR